MKRYWSIRTHLLALVGSIAIPFIGLLIHSILRDIEDDAHKANETVFSLADLTAVHIQRFMVNSEIVLSRLAQRPMVQAMDRKHLKSIFEDLMDLKPNCTNILLADKNGSLVYSLSLLSDGERLNLSQSNWFRSALDQAKFSVGSVTWDPISKKHYCILAYPVSQNNQVVGVLGMAIDLMHFQKVFLNLKLPDKTTLTVSDPEGIVVSRSMDPEKWIGKNVRSTEISDIILSRTVGHAEARGIDGEKRIYGFTTVPVSGWRVYAGIPTSVAYEVSHAVAFQNIMMALIIIVLVLLLAIYLSRKIESPVLQLAQATRDVAKGQLNTRVEIHGPSEIANVAQQFNQMLDARARVEADLQKAHLRLQMLSKGLFQAQEGERRLIARELHDEIGQALTAIKINLQALERFPDSDTLSSRLGDSIKIVERTLQQVRDLSLDLRPQLLDDLGLSSALRWYVWDPLESTCRHASLSIL